MSEYILGDDPLEVLARSNALTFTEDKESKEIYQNPLTVDDIKINCDDLKVLSKKDFKMLLKWRDSIRRSMGLTVSIKIIKSLYINLYKFFNDKNKLFLKKVLKK